MNLAPTARPRLDLEVADADGCCFGPPNILVDLMPTRHLLEQLSRTVGLSVDPGKCFAMVCGALSCARLSEHMRRKGSRLQVIKFGTHVLYPGYWVGGRPGGPRRSLV